jgi:small conductance mechanosensitive channel
VVIPNSEIVGEILHNDGNLGQVDVVVGLSYRTDFNLALALLHEVLGATRECSKSRPR